MLNTSSVDTLCMGCFGTLDSPGGICPACGYDETSQAVLHQLRPRTILNGKYLLGRVLGEGGFGITYIGWDLNLHIKVAIKEYYPTGFVSRETTMSTTVTPFIGSQGDYFLKGRERFINEARALAKFFSLPGIVLVKDYFQENGTAYIVMAYIEGQTLKSYLEEMGGRLPAAQVFDMMKPVMTSLAEVHKSGLIHRDISPDNIMISKEGLKLLDFGAAREFEDSGNKSLSVMLKPGFAPEEQYRTKGVQGPWTDIYALCATMYKCITGVTPDEALDRIRTDEVTLPSALGVDIDPAREAALMKGMAVLQENRWQSVSELSDALHGTLTGVQAAEPVYAAAPPVIEYTPPSASAGAVSPSQTPVIQPNGTAKNDKPRRPFPPLVSTLTTTLGIFSALVLLLFRYTANTMSAYEGVRAHGLISVPVSWFENYYSVDSQITYSTYPEPFFRFLFLIGGLCGTAYFILSIVRFLKSSDEKKKSAYIPHITAIVMHLAGVIVMAVSMSGWFEMGQYNLSTLLLSLPYAIHAFACRKGGTKQVKILSYAVIAAYGIMPIIALLGF